MSIHPQCDMCKNELTDFGALLFSPPSDENTVQKFHICKECYKKIEPDNKVAK